MIYHQKARRNRGTALHMYNLMMQRHRDRYLTAPGIPKGATPEEWLAYLKWLDDWRKVIVQYRDAELNRLDEEQKRRSNERIHQRHGKSRRRPRRR